MSNINKMSIVQSIRLLAQCLRVKAVGGQWKNKYGVKFTNIGDALRHHDSMFVRFRPKGHKGAFVTDEILAAISKEVLHDR